MSKTRVEGPQIRLLGGDVSGTGDAVSVDKIKGTPVSATPPTSGQVLGFDGSSWHPAAAGGGSNPYAGTNGFVKTNTWLMRAADGLQTQSRALAFDGASLWMLEQSPSSSMSVAKTDLNGNILARVSFPVQPSDLLFAFSHVWVAAGVVVYKIDPSTNAIVASYSAGRSAQRMTANATYIFTSGNDAEPIIMRLDPATGLWSGTTVDAAVTPTPDAIVAGSFLWIIQRSSATITRTDTAGTVLGTVDVSASGFPRNGLIVNSLLWVTMSNGDLLMLDASGADTVLATFPSGTSSLDGLAFDGQYFMYAFSDSPSNRCLPFDVSAEYFVHSIATGNTPDDVVRGQGGDGNSLWAIDRSSANIRRLDRQTGALLGTTNVSASGTPRRGMYTASFLWVVMSNGDLLKINPTTDTVSATYRTGTPQTTMSATNLASGADAVAAAVTIQDVVYTAQTAGAAGNSITIQYTSGATAGSEVVSVVGNAISVQIEDGVSTASQIVAAVNGFPAAFALVNVSTSSPTAAQNVASAASPVNLTSGADAIAAMLSTQGVTYTAVTAGAAGNSITVAYTSGGTAGSEGVSVVALAISVQIEDGNSRAAQVAAAVNGFPAASALVTAVSTVPAATYNLNGISQSDGSSFFVSDAVGKKLYQFTIGTTSFAAPVSVADTPDDIAWDQAARLWTIDFTSGIVDVLNTSGALVATVDVSAAGLARRLAPYLYAGYLWVITDSGNIVRAEADPSGAPGDIGIAFNSTTGDMWINEYIKARVRRVTPAGAQTVYPLPPGPAYPIGIAFNSATGDMWISTQGGGSVYKISPTGVYTLVASGLNNPAAMAYNPTSGDMWVVSATASSTVYKITVGGAVTTYSLPYNSQPRGIAFNSVTSDMWIANSSGSVSKITPTNIVTTYGGVPGAPVAIAFNSTTGDMWTANNSGHSVSQISGGGTVLNTYTLTGTGLIAIAFDGTNMWTANSGDSSISKVTPGGVETNYPSGAVNPQTIAFNSTTSDMWLGCYTDGKILKVSPAGGITTYVSSGVILETIPLLGGLTTFSGITSAGDADFFLSAGSPKFKIFRFLWDGGNYNNIVNPNDIANAANAATFGSGHLWTAIFGDPTLRKLRLDTGAVGATLDITAYGTPKGMTVNQGPPPILYMPLANSNLLRVDISAGAGTVLSVVNSGKSVLGGISESIGSWYVGFSSPSNGFIQFTGDGFYHNGTVLAGARQPTGMAASATDLWVAQSNSISQGPTRITVSTMAIAAQVAGTDDEAQTVALFGGFVYFDSYNNGNVVYKVDPTTNSVVKLIYVHSLAQDFGIITKGIYSDGTSIWAIYGLGTSSEDTLERIDSTDRVIASDNAFDRSAFSTTTNGMVRAGDALFVRANSNLHRLMVNLG